MTEIQHFVDFSCGKSSPRNGVVPLNTYVHRVAIVCVVRPLVGRKVGDTASRTGCAWTDGVNDCRIGRYKLHARSCTQPWNLFPPHPIGCVWYSLGIRVRALEPCAQVHYAVSLQVCTLDAIPYMICIAKAL